MASSILQRLKTNPTAVVVGVLIGVVLIILVAVELGQINSQRAGLMMDGVLTIATLGYVFLTYHLVSRMQRDIEIQERYQKRPHVVERLETALIPLKTDIQNISRTISDGEPEWNGPDGLVIDGKLYQSYHEITSGYNLRTIPRFTTHLDVDNEATYNVYQSVKEYSETYEKTVRQLKQLILDELDGFQGNSQKLRDLATLALKLDDGHSGSTRLDTYKEDIIPLRDDIPELISELEVLQEEVKTACHEALKEIDSELNHSMNEYEISEGDIDQEAPPDSEQSLTRGFHQRMGFEMNHGPIDEETEKRNE